jgi:2-polyprenyl-3-methyl-5-hydroxy-6-metoxy-1,4-benzoquinol methylase
MSTIDSYRESLYSNYFKDRYNEETIKKKLATDLIHLENEILPLLPSKKDALILDLGCGHGNLMLLLMHKGFTDVHGIDISLDQIRMAHDLGLKNAIHGDILEYLAHNAEKFDVILGIDIVEHLKKGELTGLMKEIYTGLKPNGVAVFRTPNADGIGNSVFSAGDFTHENILNGFSAEQICLSAGFKDVQVLKSYIRNPSAFQEIVRKVLWAFLSFAKRLEIFAAGISNKKVILTPNLLFKVIKK